TQRMPGEIRSPDADKSAQIGQKQEAATDSPTRNVHDKSYDTSDERASQTPDKPRTAETSGSKSQIEEGVRRVEPLSLQERGEEGFKEDQLAPKDELKSTPGERRSQI